MAGAGIKKFVTGETLSDTEVNTYLMDQVVPVFVNAAARDSAFGGVGEPALSEGRLCYLQSTKRIQFYNGVTWSDSAQFTVGDGEVTTEKLKGDPGEEAVTTEKIRNDAVTADKLADSTATDSARAVTTNHIRNAAVTTEKLGSTLTLTGTTTLAGTGKVQQLLEKAIHSASPLSGATPINVTNGAIYYYSANSTGLFQFAITASGTLNNLMATHETITLVVFCAQGISPNRLSAITIDGLSTGVTVRWFGGTAYPSGNASSVDVYTMTIIKMGTNLFEVFASQSSFKA
jgi:hypothetical protein